MGAENGSHARLRLVKAVIQFQFEVVVAGEPRPQATPPFQVDAAEWAEWARAELPSGDIRAVIQFTFVSDDGTALKEQISEPVVVEASEWKTFGSERFDAMVRDLETGLSSQ